ncbi:MAG: MBL fold metallo-hydrolase [Rhizobiaceae bacterium]|nr:MBL fold metallo-hydrolase [Rhizobiaceae bacterium]
MAKIIRKLSRWLAVLLSIVIVCVIGIYIFLQTPVFGAHPDAAQIKSFASSPQFNIETEEFQNRQPNVFAEMRANMSIPTMLGEWFEERSAGRPEQLLPEVKPDLDAFLAPSENTKLIWFGHSSFLLNMAGTIIMVDPMFSQVASPLAIIGQRFQPPVLTLEELPPIDIVLLSHDHYDHLDMSSIRYFAKRDISFIAPLGLSSHLRRWGVRDTQIIEKDWWETHKIGDVEFIAAPSQHFSGRDGIKNNSTLWASWVIRTDNSNLYFSGDSGFDIHFKTIGERYGPFDLALVEDGQYNPRWPAVHLFPEEAAEASVELKAKRAMPVHWGMFELSYHAWHDPITRFAKALAETDVALVTPIIGEIIEINDQLTNNNWWEDLIQ